MTHLFIYLLIYLSLFTVQPRFNEMQGNGKRAVLYGLVELSFDLAYSGVFISANFAFDVLYRCKTFLATNLLCNQY